METIKNLKLTGKCKQDFEIWYWDLIEKQRPDYLRYGHGTIMLKFYRSIPSMQYGVYVDFFYSVGIEIMFDKEDADTWLITLYNKDTLIEDTIRGDIYSRQEAREQTIIKTNEVYNQLEE